MKSVLSYLSRSYSLIRFNSFIWQFCVIGPLITFVYILSVKPYGFSLFPQEEQIKIAFYFSAPPMLIWTLHLYLIRPLVIKRHTILNTMLFIAWISAIVGLYNYTFAEIYIFGSLFDFYWLPMVLKQSMSLGVLVTMILASSHAGWIMRRRILKKKKDWAMRHLLDSAPKVKHQVA